MTFRKHTIAAVLALMAANSAWAGLALQSDQPIYMLNEDGTTRTVVNVYLRQTDGTTSLSDHGGLNSFQIQITPAGEGIRPVLEAIDINPAFTGNTLINVADGILGGSFMDLVSGVTVSGDQVFLGRYAFTGTPGVTATTYAITSPGDGYTYTPATVADGSDAIDLGGQIVSGGFVLLVPEPGGLVVLGLGGLLGLSRRRA